MASPPDVVNPADVLGAPPVDRYALLEFAVEWDDLAGIEAQLAAALRLFVITRDPLDWLPDRGTAWATSNGDGDNGQLELPIYVTLDEVRRRLTVAHGDVAAALGPLCDTALLGAMRCQGVILAGVYPELAFRGEVPSLLVSPGEQRWREAPTMTLADDGWEPMGLGAIQDLVQAAFGPVDLDRSAVALPSTNAPRAGCPACAGIRFGFPGDLAQAQLVMCEPHRAAAERITQARIARARTSNPAGWRAIGKGSARISGTADPVGTPMPERRHAAAGRNDPCPCGSGRKYKHCCGA